MFQLTQIIVKMMKEILSIINKNWDWLVGWTKITIVQILWLIFTFIMIAQEKYKFLAYKPNYYSGHK